MYKAIKLATLMSLKKSLLTLLGVLFVMLRVSGLPEVKWNKKNVVEFIEKCRKDCGIPMFKTAFFFKATDEQGNPVVFGHCWGGYGKAPDMVVFVDVPPEDYNFVKLVKRDWEALLKFYAPEKLPELESLPIIIKGRKFTL